MGAKRSPGPTKEKAKPEWRKVTMDLPRDVAKRLHLMAIERETTIGKLAAPAIKAMLGGSYFVDHGKQPLAIAEETTESGDPLSRAVARVGGLE